MAGYHPYSEYKDSKVSWLCNIPKNWGIKRLKFTVNLIGEKLDAEASDLDYMGLEHIEPWSGNRIEDEHANSEGVAARFLPKDVLFGKLRPYLAKVHLANHEGLVSTEALVLRSSSQVHEGFLRYFMVSRDFIRIVDSSTYGSKMPRASWDFIGNLPMLLPIYEEQQKIARFLDHKTAQIDALIAKKEALLDKLAEKRTALISHAVTKGLNPQAKMKDSGVEWLGMIPQSWERTKVKFIGDVILGLTYSPNDVVEDGILVLRSSNVQDGKIDMDDCVYVSCEIPPNLVTKKNDILICSRNGSRSLIGKCALIDEMASGQTFGAFMTVLRTEHAGFLYYILNSSLFKFQSGRFLTATINQLTTQTLGGFEIALPPCKEQKEIVDYLIVVTGAIDKQFQKASEVVGRLKEYRSALITQAVTGKIDVREVEIPEA